MGRHCPCSQAGFRASIPPMKPRLLALLAAVLLLGTLGACSGCAGGGSGSSSAAMCKGTLFNF